MSATRGMSGVSESGERAPVSLRGGAGEAIWHLGGLLTLKASAVSTAGAFDLIEEFLPPGVSPPWHVHHREDESFYVLDGRVAFYLGDAIIHAERGAYVFLPRGIAHTFRVEGEEPARMLELNAPAGLWGFFRDVGEPAQARTLAPSRGLDLAKLRTAAARYGIDILGPANE